MSEITVYKVVERRGERLFSAVAEEPLEVEYKPGEWVSAKIGLLFAFRAQEAAAIFAGAGAELEIWKAEAQGVKTIERILSSDELRKTPPSWIASWWDGRWVTEKYSAKPPPGTVVCGRVKLLRRLKSWKKKGST